MKNALLCCILLAVLCVSGCVMRTYTVQMDRVDQEISGNRGVIMGTPPAVEETTQTRKTREIYNIEVELPSAYTTKQEIKDKELYGNRGYLQGGMVPEKEVYVSEKGEGGTSAANTRLSAGPESAGMPQIVYSEPSAAAQTEMITSGSGSQGQYYIVQKGDTLQTISKKFFGTTKKWKGIYDANRHVLKSPDRIRPGQKLVIPK